MMETESRKFKTIVNSGRVPEKGVKCESGQAPFGAVG